MSKKEDIEEMLNKIFVQLEHNYCTQKGMEISLHNTAILMNDVKALIKALYDIDFLTAGIQIRKHYLYLLNLLVEIDTDKNRVAQYCVDLEEAYRMSGRTNFEHFVIYYEWEEKDKFYMPRYSILHSYAYYLNKMVFDPKFNLLIVNLPSGTGKTYLEKLHEAFSFGVDPTGTCLYLCSNDDVVMGGSRTVKDIIKNERFGQVFPDMVYSKDDKGYFQKETEGEWKLRDCKLMASYYAKTTLSNVIGCRASKTIHIDDLYADYKEALDENTNAYFYNKYVTVWRKRYVQNKIPKIIVTGTMWSPTDFMVKVIDLAVHEDTFYNNDKFKYVRTNQKKDERGKLIPNSETQAIIQIPAMDYDTGESTCKNLWTTEQLEKEKDSMETYLWETNFQQKPTSPEGLEFDWNNIRLYDKVPESVNGYTYAVIDGTRKSGKDYFSMPIFALTEDQDYALVDCIFTKIASSELIEPIVDKMLEDRIRILVIESNVDGGLKKLIEQEYERRGIKMDCVIIEKYNTVQKSIRIELEKGIIKKRLIFPHKSLFSKIGDMGKFMNNFTLYNSQGINRNDDACFEGNTLIATQFGYKPIKDIKVGDKVLTPFGLRKVTSSGVTGYKETINKFGLQATPNHKIFNLRKYEFECLKDFENIYDTMELKYRNYILARGRTYLYNKNEKCTRNELIEAMIQTSHYFLIGLPYNYLPPLIWIKETINYAIFKLFSSVQKYNIVERTNNTKIPVYNITVENAGCYYANGILVSNCDSAAMFTSEIIGEKSKPRKAKPVRRIF